MSEVYLDYNATTPIDPRVFEAMKPFLTSVFGNASSVHKAGQAARHAVEAAREEVAAALQVEPGDVLFTSGGTEADNLALQGAFESFEGKRDGVVVTSIEHPAVLDQAKYLQKRGARVTIVPVHSDGMVNLEVLEKAVDDKTAIVSVMHANNEIGAIQPVREAARVAKAKGALFHTDAVQAFGKIPVMPEELGADLLSISSHKIYGPKGAGALYVRKGVRIRALFHGGHQEKNVRPGTENVAAIAGFGAAAALVVKEGERDAKHSRELRDRLAAGLWKAIPDAKLNGHPERRVPNTLNASFSGLEGEMLLMNLDLKGIRVSTGSACTAGSVEPSHVLLAMGLDERLARTAVRFSVGRFTTVAEIDEAIREIPPIVERLRKASTQGAPPSHPKQP